jgi:RimJ/RimL family protein N-acetyltransferase
MVRAMEIEIRPLEGRYVRLEPIVHEHRDELRAALDVDPEAWELVAINGAADGFDDWWDIVLTAKRRGERITYAIRELETDRVVGTSSFRNLRYAHRGVEIGSTFLHPDVRSGPVNPESKLLMLSHAFGAGAIRVEFLVDERNSRSQAAVLKLGATQEGVLRKHMITWTGHIRDTAIFSIVDYDWPAVKQRLEFRLREAFV